MALLDHGSIGEEPTMHKDRVKGAAKNITGKMKEAAGKMTGDSKMQTEGKMDLPGRFKTPSAALRTR